MRRCTGVTVDVGAGNYVFAEVGGVLTDFGELREIHIHDEGVVVSSGDRWSLIPWHRVRSVDGMGDGRWA